MKIYISLFFTLLIMLSCNDDQSDKEIEETTESEKSTRSFGDNSSYKIGINELSNSSLELDIIDGNKFTIYANAVPPDGFNLYSIDIIMESMGNDGGKRTINKNKELDSDGNYKEEFYMYRGGNYELKGAVKFQNKNNLNEIKGVETEEVTLTAHYPAADRVEEWVSSDMHDVWDTSISSSNQNERREYGFVIYMTADHNSDARIEKGETLKGDTNPCPTSGTLTYNLKFTYSEYELSDMEPVRSGAKYVVGIFHTHPPLTYCDSNVKRKDGVGPSEPDKLFINSMDPYVPAFVYDYSNNIQGGHSANEEAEIYHYGADRRKDF